MTGEQACNPRDEGPLTAADLDRVADILKSGMWDGTWAKETIIRLSGELRRHVTAPVERPPDADDPRYGDRLWDGTA